MAVLGVVLAGIVYWQFKPTGGGDSGKNDGAGDAKGGPIEFKPIDLDIDSLVASVEMNIPEYSEVRIERDPMAPLIRPLTAIGPVSGEPIVEGGQGAESAKQHIVNLIRTITVSGIVWDPAMPYAVVDNEIVRRGQVLPSGISVAEIGPDYVLFEAEGVQVPVYLRE